MNDIRFLQSYLPNKSLNYASQEVIERFERILKGHPDSLLCPSTMRFILTISQQNLKDRLCTVLFDSVQSHERWFHNMATDEQRPLFLQICKSLIFSADTPETTRQRILACLDRIFMAAHAATFYEYRAEIADIFLQYSPHSRNQYLRRLDDPPPSPPRPERTKIEKICNDSQNVHNSEINTSVVSACNYLIQIMVPSITFPNNIVINAFPHTTVEDVEKRIESIVGNPVRLSSETITKNMDYFILLDENEDESESEDGSGDEYCSITERTEFIGAILGGFLEERPCRKLTDRISTGMMRHISLSDLFISVLKFIHTNTHSEELMKRLAEEMTDALNVCTTGIAARLISVVQGFFDEKEHPSLKIQLDVRTEVKNIVVFQINQKVVELEADPVCDPGKFKAIVANFLETETISTEYDVDKEVLREIVSDAFPGF